MIGKLTGIVDSIQGNLAMLDVGGVGYEVRCSAKALEGLSHGEKASIVIHTEVREDSISLYGFEDGVEKQVFQLLREVKGLGAKSASDLLSQIEKTELLKLIGSGNHTRLEKLRGIGKKTAARIVVELKDKVAEYARQSVAESSLFVERERVQPVDDAVQAMCALGFSVDDAKRAVSAAQQNGEFGVAADAGEIVREALKYI